MILCLCVILFNECTFERQLGSSMSMSPRFEPALYMFGHACLQIKSAGPIIVLFPRNL